MKTVIFDNLSITQDDSHLTIRATINKGNFTDKELKNMIFNFAESLVENKSMTHKPSTEIEGLTIRISYPLR